MSKWLYMFAGWIALGLGVVGVFLPLLPTTPFLILAAFCFSKSSERLHQKLLAHKTFGPAIRDWETAGVISRKAKWLSTISMYLLVSYPIIFVIEPIWLKLLVLTCLLCVSTYIWTRPESATEHN